MKRGGCEEAFLYLYYRNNTQCVRAPPIVPLSSLNCHGFSFLTCPPPGRVSQWLLSGAGPSLAFAHAVKAPREIQNGNLSLRCFCSGRLVTSQWVGPHRSYTGLDTFLMVTLESMIKLLLLLNVVGDVS